MSQKNEAWLLWIKNADYCGTDLNRLTAEAQEKEAASMTAKKIQKAVKKYFGKMVYTRVVLEPDPEELEEGDRETD